MEQDLSPESATKHNKLKEFIKTNFLELQQCCHEKKNLSPLSLESNKGELWHLTKEPPRWPSG